MSQNLYLVYEPAGKFLQHGCTAEVHAPRVGAILMLFDVNSLNKAI